MSVEEAEAAAPALDITSEAEGAEEAGAAGEDTAAVDAAAASGESGAKDAAAAAAEEEAEEEVGCWCLFFWAAWVTVKSMGFHRRSSAHNNPLTEAPPLRRSYTTTGQGKEEEEEKEEGQGAQGREGAQEAPAKAGGGGG